MNRKQRKMLMRIIATVLAIILILIAGLEGIPRLVAFIAVYLLIGYDILKKAWHGILHRQVFDENFLMAVATLGAFALAIYEKSGDYLEAIAVMLFYQIGELFQSYAVGKSRKDISALVDLRPDYANLERDGKVEKVDPDEVEVDDIIVVNPGERVPLDGIVVSGSASLNTSALTGESKPTDVADGDEVYSGSIDMNGILRIRCTKEFDESTASKILELVEESASRKSKSENFISKFARVYTPAVCYSALALALLPPLFLIIFGHSPFAFSTFETWIYRALTFLVISCPCALVVSIPLTFFAGIGGASRQGILVKGANILETLSKVKTVVFDKTGTLTEGVFKVTGIHDSHCREMKEDADEVLAIAATAESATSHPIGKSLMEAYDKNVDSSNLSELRELSGKGITAKISGTDVAVGNDKLMSDIGVASCDCHETGTIVHVAVDGKYEGHIVLGDVVKGDSKAAIEDLHRSGVIKTVMLTGDSGAVAQKVASLIGIDKVYSQLLPGEKVSHLEEIIGSETRGGKVAYVGDGINDAPVLSRADVGIAMGALGSDAAIEAADVVLMDDDPMKIGKGIRIARKCLRIVWENIIFALGIKGACLILGVFGFVNMWLAIFADVGVMIIAVLNAVRAMFTNKT